MGPNEADIYDHIGEAGFSRLAASFYRRVREDDRLGPMYPQHDFSGAERRLRDFLIFRFGGPPRYIQQRGHPRLRMRHVPFPIDQSARDRWVLLMDQALQDSNLTDPFIAVLRPFLHQTASFMINRHTNPMDSSLALKIVPPDSNRN